MRYCGFRLTGVLLAFCTLLVFQGVALGQTNRISGQVYGANRRPLSDVYVELKNELGTVISRTKTAGAGSFQFIGISSGRFTVLVRPFGTDYEEQSQEAEIVNIVQGGRRTSDSINLDFFLRARRTAPEKPGVAGVVFAQEIPPDAKQAYDRAISDLDGGRTDAGIAGLENSIKLFPDYFYALDRLGGEQLKKAQFAQARTTFQKATAVNTKSSNSWYGLAFALYAENLTSESIDAAKKAVDIAPDSPDINLMFGIALRKGKQYNEAEKSMLKAKKLTNGQLADASWNLALLYVYNLKNNRRAADELENYLKIKPDHPDAAKLKKLIGQFRGGA